MTSHAKQIPTEAINPQSPGNRKFSSPQGRPFRAPQPVTVATQGGAPDGRLPWANLGLPRWGELVVARGGDAMESDHEQGREF